MTVSQLNDLLDRYVALWNEPDAAVRRDAVAQLWVPDGIHFTQTRKFRGTDALHARITEAHEQFVAGTGLRFRSGENLVTHHDVATFSWEISPAAGGNVQAVGSDFVLLDRSGRIFIDYQFNEPPAPVADLDAFARRYLALAHEPDAELRRKAVAELYTPDARLVDDSAEHLGRAAVHDSITTTGRTLAANGLTRRLTGHASAHHNAIRFTWDLAPTAGGPPVASGLELLLQDTTAQIRGAYRFTT
ncbi:hypothetical protein P3T37_004559 [Kitasatospora sp. MAA4]|uniref:hypothetical protein n=1 Tax=Kitasatospora sp. MAA4 TaxID=3035093 RepID=UPI002475C0AA|nr:hypothetical protein [Kitasatospora sp. MAA4]MDH6135149.1 hypothetical protein [Kitasatospora sp. MAA4]